jgi:hypothetical protein
MMVANYSKLVACEEIITGELHVIKIYYTMIDILKSVKVKKYFHIK